MSVNSLAKLTAFNVRNTVLEYFTKHNQHTNFNLQSFEVDNCLLDSGEKVKILYVHSISYINKGYMCSILIRCYNLKAVKGYKSCRLLLSMPNGNKDKHDTNVFIVDSLGIESVEKYVIKVLSVLFNNYRNESI